MAAAAVGKRTRSRVSGCRPLHFRSEGQIVKKAVYIAIGIDLDGRKDALGMWIGENESAKY